MASFEFGRFVFCVKVSHRQTIRNSKTRGKQKYEEEEIEEDAKQGLLSVKKHTKFGIKINEIHLSLWMKKEKYHFSTLKSEINGSFACRFISVCLKQKSNDVWTTTACWTIATKTTTATANYFQMNRYRFEC